MHKVAVIGSGNWGSVIARIVGLNILRNTSTVHSQVNMWVYEETFNGQKLTEIINKTHINEKYLPGVMLPSNVVADADMINVAKDATLLIFVLPHQFVAKACELLKGRLHPDARAISLIKGVEATANNELQLISTQISQGLGIDVSVLMGANIAAEVAQQQFSESTLGYTHLENALLFKSLLDTPYFRISMQPDVAGVELCGALKNIVAVASGLAEGQGMGANTRAAILRTGLMEMMRFSRMFYEGVRTETFFESCGVADLVATCEAGRNKTVAAAFAKAGGSSKVRFEDLEKDLLKGQKCQGTGTAREVYGILKERGCLDQFPLFAAVHEIVYEGRDSSSLLRGF